MLARRRNIFAVVITIIYSVAISDMIFGPIIKAEFEPVIEQQLAT